MLRELTIEEMDFVSGGVGDIVVTGSTMTSRNSINEFFDNASAWNSILQNASNAVLDADSADDYGQEDDDTWDGDHDHDGTPNSDDPDFVIVVTGSPHMANEWEEMSWGDRLQWLSAFAISGGNDQMADIVAGTDLSGQNPYNPYQSEEEVAEDLGDAAHAAAGSALDGINTNIP